MTARQRMLDRIRAALGDAHGTLPPAESVPAAAPVAASAERFAERLADAGGVAHHAADLAAAARVVDALLAGRPRVAFSPSGPAQALCGLLTVAHQAVGDRDADLLQCDAGVTSAQWGVVETGTLLLDGTAERHRRRSLLPPVHIALLPAERLVPTLGEALRAATGAGVPPVLTLVTGPSRTADIELTLVVGVHGPCELHVVLIDQLT